MHTDEPSIWETSLEIFEGGAAMFAPLLKVPKAKIASQTAPTRAPKPPHHVPRWLGVSDQAMLRYGPQPPSAGTGALIASLGAVHDFRPRAPAHIHSILPARHGVCDRSDPPDLP